MLLYKTLTCQLWMEVKLAVLYWNSAPVLIRKSKFMKLKKPKQKNQKSEFKKIISYRINI